MHKALHESWHEQDVSEAIRILLVDDHPVFLDGLMLILDVVDDIEVLGTAATGGEAVRLAEELQPDIILMDVHLPDLNGIEAVRQIIKTSPHIGILMLTMLEDDTSVFSAMRAGARGYLLKGARRREIIRAIYAVADGESIFSAAISRRMMYYFEAKHMQAHSGIFPELTSREREILSLIARGQNNSSIASALALRPKTVSNHVSNILNKLQVADRAQASILARESGME